MTNIPSEAGELLERLGVDIDAETFCCLSRTVPTPLKTPG